MVTKEVPRDEARAARPSRLILAPLLLSVSLTALDTSIVTTALPTIVGSLGGLRLFSWVFSVYLLATTITTPIYGKLADLYGRKRVLLFGISLFLLGSVLCGLAQNMEMLIVCRLIQGFGAGGVLPITQTIIGDTFSIEERAKIQGFFSGVWGVTAIAGPLVGGLITESLSWRWVFYVNLPLGLISLYLIYRLYHEKQEQQAHVLDYWGAILLGGSVLTFLLVLLQFGPRQGWTSPETLLGLVMSLALLVLFWCQERRAPEPVIPLSLFRRRVIVVSSMITFLAGGLSIGVSSFVPLFEQGVFGGTPIQAGIVIAPMSVSWIIGSVMSGKVILKYGFFHSAMVGGVLVVLGSAVFLFQTDSNSILVASFAGFWLGIGMGFVTNCTVVSVQNSVSWEQRGSATATLQFFRTIGGSISVAIFGTLLNARMEGRLEGIAGLPAGRKAELMLRESTRSQIGADALAAMEHALAASLHEVFIGVFVAACMCFAVITLVPRGTVERVTQVAGGRRTVDEP